MAQPTNRSLRLLIPAILISVGLGVVVAVFNNTVRQAQRRAPTPAATTPPASPTPSIATPTPADPTPAVGTPEPAEPPAAVGLSAPPDAPDVLPAPVTPDAPGVELRGLRAQHLERGPDTLDFTPLGSADPAGPMTMRLDFMPLGAGVQAITLARHFETIERTEHIVVQHEHTYTPFAAPSEATPLTQVIVPFAMLAVEINGQTVGLTGAYDDPTHGWVGEPVWRQTGAGQFEARIVNGEAQAVARIIRHFEIEPGSYIIRMRQWVQNLTGQPLEVRWIQFGPVDLYRDVVAYGGDRRRVRFGYLLPPEAQRGDPTVAGSDFIWDRLRSEFIGPRDQQRMYEQVRTVWPNRRSQDRGYRMVWTGMTNRYFGAALHPLLTGEVHPDAKVFDAAAVVDRVLLQRWVTDQSGSPPSYDPVLILRTTSVPFTVQPGGFKDLSMALYAGPLSRGLIGQHVSAAAAGLRELVVYNFGGPCAPCTFGFLTSGLLNLMLVLHHYVVFDWALAIILLVIIVRTCLHPVTRWSQIRLQRFGKQMADMAPKQKKLQEKFKDDPQRLREETGKLWREEGINPANAVGCLPLLLQTPIWIALFAMLFFAFELRHEAAFFGIFQHLTGGTWFFLGDLAEPDRFIYFARDLFWLPLLGPIRSFNVLPLLLGAVFYVQQKYLTPPTTVTLTPEQQQQQKMIKVMMVVLFPIFMYNAPSGLSLYFIVNSALGIAEMKWIRAHIEKHGLLEVKKQPPKPGGFLARLQALAEERQRKMGQGRGGQQPPRKKV
jgi:YidC/Oxa1 family membrane protein insertase